MSAKEAQKASAIIQQLYEARCNGNWHAVPDLVRKVEKHAPSRKCLLLASRASASTFPQPSVSAFQKAEESYGAQLAEATQDGSTSSEEVLDGVACRALMLFGMGDAKATLSFLPASLTKPAPPAKGVGHEAWTATCVVISFLVRGLALEKSGRLEEAASNYRPIISYLSSLAQLPTLAPELRRWTEELLCHICLFYSTDTSEKPAQFGQAMAVFHILSRLLETQNGALSTKLGSITQDTARQVWKAYYLAFTKAINQGLVYHPSPIERDHEVPEHRGLLEDDEYFASRVQQCKDLITVESSYEIQLMIDIKFPKAGETNVDIREFVENVMLNWRALCGPSWSDKEIGERGKAGVAKRVTEILYRAATKTFHSPQILRHLFTVHAYLSEFDLAFKSLDAYLGIMTKGKARVEKSGDAALDLDDDDQFIAFVAEAIRVACRYGACQSAERALGLGATLAQWLRTGSTSSMADHGVDKHLQRSFQPSNQTKFDPETTALAYRAIGLSLANWSRSTFEPASRASAQELATINLEHALKQGLPDSQCTETLYCLAVMLAETRQIPEAIALVRRALRSDDEAAVLAQPAGVSSPRKSSVSSRPGTSSRPSTSPRTKRESAFTKTRKMLPVWHLLAQLLSACEEFDGAASACRMAFSSLVELFSPTAQGNGLAVGQTPPSSGPGLSDAAIEALDHYEKQTLVEIQMTSVTLIGISEGPSAAVNASDDLLALYAKLFGPVKDSSSQPAQPHQSLGTRPKSSHGSIRSIFTRNKHKSQIQHSRKTDDGLAAVDKTQYSTRPSTATVGPSVQVTNHDAEDNDTSVLSEKQHDSEQKQSPLKKTASLRSRKSKEPVSNDVNEKLDLAQQVSEAAPTMPEIPHNLKHDKMPPPPGHPQQPPQQDTRLPTPLPSEDNSPIATHFDHAQELRQKRTLLVKIWLFIARLYREAEQLDDGQDALEEAMRVVEQLELGVASKDASVKKLRERGWGNGASVDELWADAYAERGDLLKIRQRVHDATAAYEAALSHNSDHPCAIVGLADILMEKYSKHVTLDRRHEAIQLAGEGMPSSSSPPPDGAPPHTRVEALERKSHTELDTPALYRLAARDRAYGLLSALTKLGTGWDNAEAWLAYARALEESGQPDRAKGALWWTVELEDTAPVRHWRHVGPGGYVL